MDEEVIPGEGCGFPLLRCVRMNERAISNFARGATEDSGMTYAVGKLISVPREEMERDGLRIVSEHLNAFRVWPAKTKLESEIGVMDSRTLSKFVREHKFVDVLKRDKSSIIVCPNHRVGRSRRGITGYIEDEIQLRMPVTQEQFLKTLTKAFELAT